MFPYLQFSYHRRCRLNLVVTAHHRRAGGGDRILVGGNRPDGSIPQDRGRLNLTHIRGGSSPRTIERSVRRLRRPSAPLDKRRRSVLSMPLRHLREGDQFEVSARLRTTIAHLPYSVRTTSHLVLASSRSDVEPGRRIRRIADLGGEIGESNGFNCERPRGACTVRKVGVMKLRGAPRGKLFVNLVLLVGPKRAQARPGDGVELRGGRIRLTRYPPSS